MHGRSSNRSRTFPIFFEMCGWCDYSVRGTHWRQAWPHFGCPQAGIPMPQIWSRGSWIRKSWLRLIASPRGCMLMNIHKSKGKEFDAVVLVEGEYASQFFDREREKFPFEESRRLFRVAATRARSILTIIRPKTGLPLVGPE